MLKGGSAVESRSTGGASSGSASGKFAGQMFHYAKTQYKMKLMNTSAYVYQGNGAGVG
jgi:hypothetical protein